MLTNKTILLATDFSKDAAYALQLAGSLARDEGARLIVLHAMPVPLVQEKTGYREEAAAALHRVEAPAPNILFERRLEEGDPVNEILRVARETKCGLIVMGTHGRTGLRRLLMGSVAEQIVRHAPCLVLTVKMPAES
ncbi:MAG: universal stress protein [Gemmataceae bacterium]|nr:universal stress protein [Gemmataceae bacterium]